MPRYDFLCINNHITEIACSHDKIPSEVTCPKCNKKSVRYYSGMKIYSKVELGTAGGLGMKQRDSNSN